MKKFRKGLNQQLLDLIGHAPVDYGITMCWNYRVNHTSDTHAALFKSISIAPEGRPSIASANYQGEHYEWISAFHRFYQTLVEYVMLDEG